MNLSHRLAVPAVVGAIGTGLLFAVLIFLLVGGKQNYLPFVYGILPALPGLIALAVVLSASARLDERERRILGSSLIGGFSISMAAFLVYGVLQISADLPGLNFALAAAFMSCAWAGSLLLAWRRHS